MTSPEVEWEIQVEDQVTGEFAAAVAAAVTAVLTAWIGAQAAGKGFDAVRALASRLFGSLRPDMRRRLVDQVRGRISSTVLAEDSALNGVLRGIDLRAARQLAKAQRLARSAPMDSLSEVTTVTAAANRAATQAQADTRWAATRTVSLEVADKAKQAGARIIWVPERDACLSCLAYAGLTVEPGELFPAGLTFGKTPANKEAIPYPPLHPNCRCQIEAWFGEKPFSDALKREAQRSVARGFSNSASKSARVDAAAKLITRKNRLPKTVQRRAARDVQFRKFSSRHNRKVPDVAPGTR